MVTNCYNYSVTVRIIIGIYSVHVYVCNTIEDLYTYNACYVYTYSKFNLAKPALVQPNSSLSDCCCQLSSSLPTYTVCTLIFVGFILCRYFIFADFVILNLWMWAIVLCISTDV